MVSRWDVERALRWSNLRPMARLVVYALLTKANNDTAAIPPEHSPSVSTIAAITGMSRSVVAEQLPYLEKLDWLKRMSPGKASRYDRNNYALLVGRLDPERPSSPGDGPLAESAVREADGSRPAETDSAVREADGSNGASSPGDGLPVVREADGSQRGSSPGAGHATTTYIPITTTTSSSSSTTGDEEDRPDVEALCRHLADRIEGNGSLRPTIGKRWRDSARLLLDKDRRTFDQIMKAIDWSQDNEFWRANILSMPTLREKYDKLRLDALREKKQSARPPNRLKDTNTRDGEIDYTGPDANNFFPDAPRGEQ